MAAPFNGIVLEMNSPVKEHHTNEWMHQSVLHCDSVGLADSGDGPLEGSRPQGMTSVVLLPLGDYK